MGKGYQFRRSRPPQMRDYVWPTVATLLAIGLSLAEVVAIINPAQRSDNPIDNYAFWIVALLSWLIPFIFWAIVATRRRQFRRGEPVLLVDDRGMSVTDWRGNLLNFRWPEFERLERVQSGRDDELWFRAGKFSGAISLNDLDFDPNEVVEIINRSSGRSK